MNLDLTPIETNLYQAEHLSTHVIPSLCVQDWLFLCDSLIECWWTAKSCLTWQHLIGSVVCRTGLAVHPLLSKLISKGTGAFVYIKYLTLHRQQDTHVVIRLVETYHPGCNFRCLPTLHSLFPPFHSAFRNSPSMLSGSSSVEHFNLTCLLSGGHLGSSGMGFWAALQDLGPSKTSGGTMYFNALRSH